MSINKKEGDTVDDVVCSQGRGKYAIRKWDDIRKSGGLAPSIESIEKYLGGDDSMAKPMTRQQVINRIVGYFQSITEVYAEEETGRVLTRWLQNPTKAGLARALGVRVETLSRYASDKRNAEPYSRENSHAVISPEDFDLIHKSYCIISEFYEGQLGKNQNNSGSIFWLLNKNSEQWTNQQKISIENSENKLTADMTPDEIAKMIEQDIPVDEDFID